MNRYLVALNDVKTFSESAIKEPETIRERFQEKYPPEVLYEEGDKDKPRVIGCDQLRPMVIYVWFTKDRTEVWRDKEILQNALFCSSAVYDDNPLHNLNESTI